MQLRCLKTISAFLFLLFWGLVLLINSWHDIQAKESNVQLWPPKELLQTTFENEIVSINYDHHYVIHSYTNSNNNFSIGIDFTPQRILEGTIFTQPFFYDDTVSFLYYSNGGEEDKNCWAFMEISLSNDMKGGVFASVVGIDGAINQCYSTVMQENYLKTGNVYGSTSYAKQVQFSGYRCIGKIPNKSWNVLYR